MDKLEHIEQNATLKTVEGISPYDVLNHFNEHVFPGIKAKFFPQPVKAKAVTDNAKRSFLYFFRKNAVFPVKEEIKAEPEPEKEEINYTLFWAETAKGIFELVVGNYTNDVKRIDLFTEVMYAEIETTAYCNACLNFSNCAEMFETGGAKDKSRIIKESLELCRERFGKNFLKNQEKS